MKYYKLIYDYENDDNYVGCLPENMYGIDEFDIMDGEKICKWNCDISFAYNPDEGNVFTDYLANSYRWLIVSSKFRNVMDELLSKEVEYLPINIINKKDKTIEETYTVMNVIVSLDALDLENSIYNEFELDDEKIISVERYTLKKESIKKHHIFKLKGDTIPVFVSEKVKDIIINNDLLGFAFLEVKVV